MKSEVQQAEPKSHLQLFTLMSCVAVAEPPGDLSAIWSNITLRMFGLSLRLYRCDASCAIWYWSASALGQTHDEVSCINMKHPTPANIVMSGLLAVTLCSNLDSCAWPSDYFYGAHPEGISSWAGKSPGHRSNDVFRVHLGKAPKQRGMLAGRLLTGHLGMLSLPFRRRPRLDDDLPAWVHC